MQIHVKLQIWTNKFVWFKQIYIIRGDFWWVDCLNSPILWKFNNRPTVQLTNSNFKWFIFHHTFFSLSWRSAMLLQDRRGPDKATPISSTPPLSTCTLLPTRWGCPELFAPLDQLADPLNASWNSLKMAWMLLGWTFLMGKTL